jgi:terminase, large subunit
MASATATAPRREWLAGTESALRPPPRLSLSQWADQYFYLSAESSAEPGRWRTLPYQRGVMDAITDPAVWRVTLMKSARVGFTKLVDAAIGYYMHYDPCPIMVVQPTVEDAKGYSKDEIAPMLRDCPVLTNLVRDVVKTSAQTILHKAFPGGSISVVGANSGRGFRRVSRRVVVFDEVDGYPPSAGAEGDQIKLGIRRSEYYWNRKIIAGSTPLVAGASRIEEMFESGDRRRYYVPCPSCGYMDILTFREEAERGHWMQWPDGEPEKAYFVCRGNGCIIEDHQKRAMLERGEWRAHGEFSGHASFHIWTAYSLSPNATWGQLAAEFVDAKSDPSKLKTFVNTVLGETWHERGEAPDWERLFLRRETYPIGSAPAGVEVATVGVDVQKDRFVWEAVGWALNKESWAIDTGEIFGDTSDEATWAKLEELLGRTFPADGDRQLPIAMMAVDSGYNTQQVYNWCRRHPMSRVIATKGVQTARTLITAPSAVDVTVRGKTMSRGYKVWPVGVSIAKSELYGWLRLPRPAEGEPWPPGFCHFPELPEEYFKQLTAEHLVAVKKKRTGFVAHEWQIQPGRQNHWLDCRVLARAAAAVLGIDRVPPPPPRGSPGPATDGTPAARPGPRADGPAREAAPEPSGARKTSGWLSKNGRGRPGGGWLGRRR